MKADKYSGQIQLKKQQRSKRMSLW